MNININLKNCYGIKALEYEFKYGNNQSTYAIYAPNGVMKTSFARVFDDYSKKKTSSDLLNPELNSISEIVDEESNPIDPESIFVIKPYDKEYISSKMTTLLVNPSLKAKYEEVYEKIRLSEDDLVRKISSISGIRKNLVELLCTSLGDKGSKLPQVMLNIKELIHDGLEPKYSEIKYSSIINKDVETFLKSKEFRDNLKEYADKYEELLQKTRYLKVGFDHYNAETIQKNLTSNNYFKANHTINLVTAEGKREVSTEKELEHILDEEKESVFEDKEIKKIFNKIDQKISNASLREFRTFIFEHRGTIPELLDLKNFEKKIWVDYIKTFTSEYNRLLDEYETGKDDINRILATAREERTKWEEVIEIFNSRFFVPFNLKLVNKEDSIVKSEAPSIEYYHKDSIDIIEKNLLTNILSQGELLWSSIFVTP